jgi:rubrerythrin
MHKMTEDNLKAAFAGESQAHMRYLIFADKAEKEGFPNVARLFRAISFAEQAHATNHFRTLGGIGSTAENLGEAIGGETYEVEEMYPAFLAVAEAQGEKSAVRSMTYALQAEKIHAAMYQEAKQSVQGGKDVELRTVYICEVCGYTVEGEAPDRCPVCNAPKDRFRAF